MTATVHDFDPNYDLKQRLETVRAERQKLADEREAREQERALADLVEQEERSLRNERAIAEAEAAHGALGKKIAAVEARSGVVIVKRPHHVLFRKFTDASKFTSDECEKLVRPSLVYPDKATFDSWAEEEPAIIVRAANACAMLAGVRGEEASGKS